MIEIYASRLSDDGKEQFEVLCSQTILTWLHSHGIGSDAVLDSLPMSVYLNGEQVLPSLWWNTHFGPEDRVEIYREPKGTDPFSITFALIFGAKAVLSSLMPKIPNMPGSPQGSGKALNDASAKGNKVKLNDVIPECAGYNPQRYLDYLTVPRRYFAGPREQRVEMMLCVGMGEYQIQPSSVKVGQTSLLSLGDDAEFTIYQPGQDISGDLAHLFWYTAPEVGASSTGAAGLELTVASGLTQQATSSVFNFLDDTVSIPVGAGSFPADWTPGLVLNVVAPYSYTIDDGTGVGGRDVINGPISQHGFVIGDAINIQGNNQGDYVVTSVSSTTLQLNYAGGAAGTGLIVGPVIMSMAFASQRFRIVTVSANTMTVERIRNDGTADGSWPGWDALSSNQAQVRLDSSNLEGGYRGPFTGCPANEVVTQIEWDVFFPSGLTGLGREGQFYEITSTHVFEYRDQAVGGSWTTITKACSGSSLDAQGFTFREVLPYPMRPECRIKRLPPVGSDGRNDEAHDDVVWYGLRGLMPSSTVNSFPGMTSMSANIRGGDRISSQSEALINLECTRILPVLRGGVWQSAQPTREISAWVGHVVRSVGYSDTVDLNITELERLESTYWTPRGETYDKVVTSSDTVKGNLIECLQAGMSELTVSRGQITPVREGVRGTNFDAVYNPEIMLEPLDIDVAMPDQPDDFNGVDVEYYDQGTRQDETVPCRLPGDSGTRVEKIRVEGVTSRTRAWRIGMRRRRSQVYQVKNYQFQTELMALNSEYKDYVALGTSTPGTGQSSYLEAYVTAGGVSMLTSARPLDWSRPGQHKVAVRRLDGTVSGPYEAERVDDYNLRIQAALDFEPDFSGEWLYPVIQFGHEDAWCYPAIIEDVTPRGTRTCTVKAVNYDARVYADDDNFPDE